MASPIEYVIVAPSEPLRLCHELAEAHREIVTLRDDKDEIDFSFYGNERAVLFERKTATDLINSFLEANEKSGEPRVWAQIRRMVDKQKPSTMLCILVEGHIYNRRGYAYCDGVKRKVPFNAVDNFLVLVQRWGIQVVRSPSITHTVPRMISVAEGWLSTADKNPVIMLPKAPAPQLRTLMTLPGIGIKTAQKQAARHITLRHALTAYLFATFHGLGKKEFQRVTEYLDAPILLTKKGKKS